MNTEADLLSVPTGLNDDVCTTGPGTDDQDDLPCEFFRFSEINRMHDPAILSIPQPFVCSSINPPHREPGVVVASDRYYQVIEASRDLGTAPQIMCRRSVVEGDNFIPGPMC